MKTETWSRRFRVARRMKARYGVRALHRAIDRVLAREQALMRPAARLTENSRALRDLADRRYALWCVATGS